MLGVFKSLQFLPLTHHVMSYKR